MSVVETAEGTLAYNKELKGFDLVCAYIHTYIHTYISIYLLQVRRDWCVLSKETGRFVIDQILSGENRDAVGTTYISTYIHTYIHTWSIIPTYLPT